MWIQRRSGQSHHRLHDHRDPYERDLTRIIHSPAFRRLQRKTQIHSTKTGDFHRTRLTHSLEVASIARGIVRNLYANTTLTVIKDCLPSDDLISAIALLHDIGHPPFGHGGEAALHYAMHKHGGFESNAQTLHLVTKTETSYGAYGLDLTRRTLLGILKYPAPLERLYIASSPHIESYAPDEQKKDQTDRLSTRGINNWIPPKGYYTEDNAEVAWILAPFTSQDCSLFQKVITKPNALYGQTVYKSFDCSIMDLADDIAYGIHDLEDAIHLQLITRDMLDTQEFKCILRHANFSHVLLENLFSNNSVKTKTAIGDLVHYCITQALPVQANPSFESPILQYHIILPDEAKALISHLKQFIHIYVIDSKKARHAEYLGQTILLSLFDMFQQHPEHLNEEYQQRYKQAQDIHEAMRVICDYIANMSDEQATRIYEAKI